MCSYECLVPSAREMFSVTMPSNYRFSFSALTGVAVGSDSGRAVESSGVGIVMY